MSKILNNDFKTEFDKALSIFIKEGAVPPPIPGDVYELNPWSDIEGEEKPIGSMSKDELSNFVKNLDDKTFEELKTALEKIDMPEADDVQNIDDEGGPVPLTSIPAGVSPEDRIEDFVSMLKEDLISPEEFWRTLQEVSNKMVENFKNKRGLAGHNLANDMGELVDEVLGPEKTVYEAMQELPDVERDNFLKKLRLSKRD